MDLAEAWQRLGVAPTDHLDTIRGAFRAQMLALHPDHNDAPLAHERTAALTDAYRIVQAALSDAPPDGGAEPDGPSGPDGPDPSRVIAAQTARDTISITGPPTEAVSYLKSASDRFGELLLVDWSAGLIQAAIEFVDGPACHVLMALQGRAHDGTTDVFVTIDSLESRAAPDLAAVTALIVEFLNTAP